MNAKALTRAGSDGEHADPGRMTQHHPVIEELHILWITGGLGCDCDSVSITAAQQPSIEDMVLGAIPGLACGVHMYVGDGKTVEATHSPMFGVGKV